MSSPSDNPKRWLEEELRDVPVPEGLRARLKGIAAATDEELDIALRSVSLPVGLAAQLKSIPADAALDRRLKDIPVPASLSKRLHEIAAWTDDEIDTQLSDVEVPANLSANLRAVAQTDINTRRTRRQMVQWVLAASLLITVSLAYMAAAGNMVMAMFQGKPVETELELLVASNDAIEMEWIFDEGPSLQVLEVEEVVRSRQFLDEPVPVIAQWEVNFDLLVEPITDSGMLAEIDQLFTPGSSDYVNPLTDIFLAKHDFLATPVVDTVPVLETIDALPLRGITPPLVPAAKFQSLIVEGKSPLVSPAAHRLLSTARVPLSCSTLGYDLAWRDLLAGRVPDAYVLRTEDFLAGLNYDFELPRESALGLRTTAGPAPFADGDLSLLQIGVPASAVQQNNRPPVQMTIAIDGSVSMTKAGQFAQLRRVLSQLDAVLGPEDRISVVLLGEDTEVLLEDATREAWPQLALLLDSLPARNSSNLAGGLREAALVARRVADGEHRQRLVLISDGLREATPAVMEQLSSMAADLAMADMPVDVMQVLPLQASIDTGLRTLAQAGEGRLYPAESAEAIRSALVELVAGPNQVVARGAKLSIEFLPAVVAEYRLVGHEPNGSGGLLGGPLEVNLYAGQTATALFEVKLKPTGGDEVATAVLTWTDAQTGKQQTLRQKISRLQFATSVLESPVSLQRAAVAAQAAEVLRLSRSSSARTSGLRRLAQHANQLPTHTRRDPAFKQMLSLIDVALQVQTGRSGN